MPDLTPQEPVEVPETRPVGCRPYTGAGGQPLGLRTWSTDRCVNVILGEFILSSSHAPLFDNGLIPAHLDVGYTYPITIELTRVKYFSRPGPVIIPPEQDPNVLARIYESCRLHIGWDVIFNGYEHVVICGRRFDTEPVEHMIMQSSFIWRSNILAADDRLYELLDFGYEYEIGSYPTPVAIEVHIGSGVAICGILV